MTSLKKCDIFEKSVTYVMYARSGVEYYTNDLSEVYEFVKTGWKFNSYYNGYRLVPPEETIADITNYQKASQYSNLEFNLFYYDFLKKLLLSNKLNYFINAIIEEKNIFYKNFKYLVSYGPILETEIRISGSDNRIKNLKMDMADKYLNSKSYLEYEYRIKKEVKLKNNLVERKIPLNNRNNKEQEFFNELDKKIKLIKDIKTYNESIFDIDNLQVIDFKNIDVILFLPFGCFKYLSSFVNSDLINKIMFYEIHAEKTKGTSFELFPKDLNGKNVLIIDNMYSGKTIELTKEKVRKRGGIPIVLGLNPKNKNNILMSDYTMILNKILKKEDLDLKKETLFRDLYIDILSVR